MVVQVNGKLREQLVVDRNLEQDELINEALRSEKIQKYISGKEMIKKIVVPNKLINFVIKEPS